MQGEERIDGYIVYRNDNIFTNSASLTLFRAMNTMNQTMCVCQVVGDGGLDKIKGYEYTSRLDMVNKFGFKGYLKLVHHKIMNTSSYFFFHVEGPIESSAQLMRNGYQFSNVELTRIGLLMLCMGISLKPEDSLWVAHRVTDIRVMRVTAARPVAMPRDAARSRPRTRCCQSSERQLRYRSPDRRR